jgi:hypothetical protein
MLGRRVRIAENFSENIKLSENFPDG